MTIARRAEVRIGELDQKRKRGGEPDRGSKSQAGDIARNRREEFRTMAEAAPAIEEVLGANLHIGDENQREGLSRHSGP